MRRFLGGFVKLWGRAAGHGLVVVCLDFALLAFASYLGYAIRLSVFIPRLYAIDCARVALLFPALVVVLCALLGQYRTLWRQAGLEDYGRFFWLYLFACAILVGVNRVWRFALFPRS
ncbi:MAG: hypothetical protein IJR68_07745, partial [Fretibacterium sp.]|nr:hypothetical protein [Fretibacterium sp.]